MNLKRIEQIAKFVNKKFVAEIGADHGYITKHLFDTKKISKAVLTDISANSLQKARTNLKGNKYLNKVFFAVGDGFKALENIENCNNQNIEIEQIIIAGMGAKEIINILTEDNNYQNFVLQPQKNVLELRQFLVKNNYKIKKDVMVKEDKIYYNIISAQKVENAHQHLTKRQLFFGLTNTKKPSKDFCDYLTFKANQYSQILKETNSRQIQTKLNLIQKELEIISKKQINSL